MAMLHDAKYRTTIQQRLRMLRPDAQRRFGKMTASQMLWHVNEAMEVALGKKKAPREKAPLPGPVMKFLVLNLPWPKGAPTLPMFVAKEEHDFDAEHARCLRLIDQLAAKDLESAWPENPIFGRVCGRDVTRLHAKHLNHHLTQFGV
jgi:hypothetical protein